MRDYIEITLSILAPILLLAFIMGALSGATKSQCNINRLVGYSTYWVGCELTRIRK